MEWMINVEMVEGSMKKFFTGKVVKALEIVKNGKTSRPTGILKEHLAASPHRKQVILQVANKILKRKNMPQVRRMSTVTIYKKSRVIDYAGYRGIKLLENGMKVVEKLLEKRIKE